MVAELTRDDYRSMLGCSLAKISMVAEQTLGVRFNGGRCSLAKISMVAEQKQASNIQLLGCSLAKISMVAEHSQQF